MLTDKIFSIIIGASIGFTLFGQTTDQISPSQRVWWDGATKFYSGVESKQEFSASIPADDYYRYPRPKLRAGFIWTSNGSLITKVTLDKLSKATIVLPPEVASFSEFEILDEDNILLWGISWRKKNGDEMVHDPDELALCVNYSILNKRITKQIKMFDKSDINSFVNIIKKTEVTTLLQYPYCMFIEHYSGVVHIFNIIEKTIKSIDLLDEKNLPEGNLSINSGQAIPWITPLENDEALALCRIWNKGDSAKGVPGSWTPVFKTIAWGTQKVSKELMEYEGHHPDEDTVMTYFVNHTERFEAAMALMTPPRVEARSPEK